MAIQTIVLLMFNVNILVGRVCESVTMGRRELNSERLSGARLLAGIMDKPDKIKTQSMEIDEVNSSAKKGAQTELNTPGAPQTIKNTSPWLLPSSAETTPDGGTNLQQTDWGSGWHPAPRTVKTFNSYGWLLAAQCLKVHTNNLRSLLRGDVSSSRLVVVKSPLPRLSTTYDLSGFCSSGRC